MAEIETNFRKLFGVLAAHEVEFILIGGVAGMAHGWAAATYDVDVVYHRTTENHRRLVAALEAHEPYLRGAPPGLPFQWDAKTIQMGLNFTLTTRIGDLDLLGEVAGGGDYSALLDHTEELVVFDARCLCVTLPKLIQLKQAAGRPKDMNAIAELEALLEERNKLSE